jgi:hypothetical protein
VYVNVGEDRKPRPIRPVADNAYAT